MTDEQKEHLGALQLEFNRQVQTKYEKGVKEHGGNLWQKSGLIDMAMEEVIDQWVYLYTLKQQLEGKTNVERISEDSPRRG